MTDLSRLLESNRVWSDELYDRGKHDGLAESPKYFWIGCCDGPHGIASRLGLSPRDLLIHRNLANIVNGSDQNCLGVLQYVVDRLEVRDIIICGHTHCRGVHFAASDDSLGMTDQWLSEIMDLSQQSDRMSARAAGDGYLSQMSARNVREQVVKLCHTQIVRDAWQRDQDLTVHGWMHDDDTGLFHTLSSRNACAPRDELRNSAITSHDRDNEYVLREEADDAATT